MDTFDRNNRIVGGAIFLASLLIYLKTVAPTVSFWDCGEFITCAHILGVPHPPGAPLHVLIVHLASLLPITDEIAFRANIVSCFCSAFTVLLGYLIVVQLLRSWIDVREWAGQVAVLAGAAVGGLTMGVSSAFWFNSVETEVYGMSMLITLLAFWIALLWMNRADEPGSDRLLLFIAFLFGLGGGVHLQCWLTIPAILLLVLFVVDRDKTPSQLWRWIAVAFVAPFLAMWTDQDVEFPFGRLLGGGLMAAAIVHVASRRPSMRNWRFWGMAALLFALGASTYGVPIIRSWADPIIDMNNPGDFQNNFQDYVLRKQYGQTYAFPRRGDFWGFQMNIFVKYFLQQFPHWLSIEGVFRTATLEEGRVEKVAFSLIPLGVGIGGALWHARRDWRRFLAMLSMFLIMGVGLVVYLNMPDPEPRERDYIFVGAYSVFALWVGAGAAGVVGWASRALRERGISHAALPVVAGAAMFVLPAVIVVKNYHDHDRTGNFLAHDYAHNILQTCERDAILFTNGDNDTYPLWFMQYVKGVRPDIRVVNLSLIKTSWYVRQLRDLEPKVPLNLSDEAIEQFQAEAWVNPKDVQVGGITIEANRVPTVHYPVMTEEGVRSIPVVEQSTRLVWRIVQQNNGKRPIYFAITVPEGNHAGLTPYFSCEGMAWRLTPQKNAGRWGFNFDVERTRRNLFEGYRFTGLDDPSVYNDDVERRLLSNYQFIFDSLLWSYQQIGQDERVIETVQRYEKVLPFSLVPLQPAVRNDFCQNLSVSAGRLAEKGQGRKAAEALELILRIDPDFKFDGLSRDQVQNAIQALKRGEGAALPLLKK